MRLDLEPWATLVDLGLSEVWRRNLEKADILKPEDMDHLLAQVASNEVEQLALGVVCLQKKYGARAKQHFQDGRNANQTLADIQFAIVEAHSDLKRGIEAFTPILPRLLENRRLQAYAREVLGGLLLQAEDPVSAKREWMMAEALYRAAARTNPAEEVRRKVAELGAASPQPTRPNETRPATTFVKVTEVQSREAKPSPADVPKRVSVEKTVLLQPSEVAKVPNYGTGPGTYLSLGTLKGASAFDELSGAANEQSIARFFYWQDETFPGTKSEQWHQWKTVLLDQRTSFNIGRVEVDDDKRAIQIPLQQPSIARLHARLEKREGVFYAQRQGRGKHWVVLNGRHLKDETPVPLGAESRLELGDETGVVHCLVYQPSLAEIKDGRRFHLALKELIENEEFVQRVLRRSLVKNYLLQLQEEAEKRHVPVAALLVEQGVAPSHFWIDAINRPVTDE